MTDDPAPMSFRARCATACRVAIRLAAVIAVAAGIHWLMNWVTGLEIFANGHMRYGMIFVVLLAYALLIAVPFVPGVEIGLALMVMEGPAIAPLVYTATALGLSIAYCVGEWVPYRQLDRLFADFRMTGACRLLQAIQPLGREERLTALNDRAPRWLRPLTTQFRYPLIAVLVNLPGNSVIGGGGGILFTAGLSRLFHPLPMLLTILIAVSPVPLAVWLFNIDLGGCRDCTGETKDITLPEDRDRYRRCKPGI